MTNPVDMSWHPWYTYFSSNKTMNSNSITYERNTKELVWYQEYIYQDGSLIGEIFTDIENQGYNLRKLTPAGEAMIFETVGHFETVSDAKSFVNQAGGI